MLKMHNLLEKIFGWLYPLLRKISLGNLTASYISLILNILILFIKSTQQIEFCNHFLIIC